MIETYTILSGKYDIAATPYLQPCKVCKQKVTRGQYYVLCLSLYKSIWLSSPLPSCLPWWSVMINHDYNKSTYKPDLLPVMLSEKILVICLSQFYECVVFITGI